jgi:O-antigen ligase
MKNGPAPGGVRERLTFNYGGGTVPGRELIGAPQADTTFATATYAEPRDWGYAGLLAFTAVMLTRPQDLIPGLSALHLAELSAIIGIAPMLLHRFARRLPTFRVTPETFGLLLFGFAIVFSVPFSVWPGGALHVFTDVYLKILVVFVLMMNTLTTPKRLDQITWLIVVCCGYVATLAVMNYARGQNLVENGRLAGPVSGIFGNPNDLAMNMVTFMPAAIVVALTARHTMLRRAVAAGIALLMLATIVLTQSRAGVIGFASMVVVLVLLGRNVRPGFGAIALAAVIAAMPMAPASFWNRMASITDSKTDDLEYTGSREARRQLIREGFKVFVERPLTGVGAGQFENYNPPGRQQQWRETHNAPLQVAAETGVIGLVAFCFLIVRGAISTFATRRLLARPPRRRPDSLKLVMTDDDRQILRSHSVAMSAALAGWFVCSLFASVAYNWTFYYVLALIVCGRELAQHRLVTARAMQEARARSSLVPARFWRRLMPHTT